MDVCSQITDSCRLYAPCQDLCSTKYAINLLGLAGRPVSLSDVGPSDLAAKETYTRAGDYNIQHKALNNTQHACLLTVASHHSFTDN